MAFDAGLEPTSKSSFKSLYNYSDFLKAVAIPPPVKEYLPSPFFQCPCRDCVRMRSFEQSRRPVDRQRDLAFLKVARARIEQGWVQGTTVNRDGVCSIGALLFAVLGRDLDRKISPYEEADVERLARHVIQRGAEELIRFNDARGRTKAEVLALFDDGIARLEASL